MEASHPVELSLHDWRRLIIVDEVDAEVGEVEEVAVEVVAESVVVEEIVEDNLHGRVVEDNLHGSRFARRNQERCTYQCTCETGSIRLASVKLASVKLARQTGRIRCACSPLILALDKDVETLWHGD